MCTPIISDPIPVHVAGDDDGSFEMRHVTSGENFYCIQWKVAALDTWCWLEEPKDLNLKSPLFKVPEKYQCKWYLSLDVKYRTSYLEYFISSLHLVLDHESDCKEAFVKYNLFVITHERDFKHNCRFQLASTFKFDTKFQNRKNVLSMTRKNPSHRFFTVICEIMIENIIPQDDTFLADFSLLFKNQLFVDFVISVGEKTYPVHKLILATRSSVLAAMFAHDVVEKKGLMCIKDIDENVFEGMLHYIYTGGLRESEQSFEDLLIAADKYDLKGLRIRCEEKLILGLSSSNAFDVLLLAKAHNANHLKSAAIEFITSNRVVITSAWDRVWQTEPELMRDILEAFLQNKTTPQ